MIAPACEAATRELEPDIRVVKLNPEVEQSAAAQQGRRRIPSMIVFGSG